MDNVLEIYKTNVFPHTDTYLRTMQNQKTIMEGVVKLSDLSMIFQKHFTSYILWQNQWASPN